MFFKTLHWYIFRELLKIFVLTASALTSLMALGGVFKPFTKRGIEIFQLLSIMMNLMPAMLAYAIPVAALFAAVQVYWRLSTDNELTACRASGISFVTIVIPALILGVSVALVDLAFVNYVVPVFLERTERAVLSDIGSLIVSQVGRQETVPFKDYVIYADSAHEEPNYDPNSKTVTVVLEGMAATRLKNGKPSRIFTAREAKIIITPSVNGSDPTAKFELTDAAAFDEPKLQKVTGPIDSLTGAESITIPSLLKSKPKFEDIGTLKAYAANLESFPPIHDIIQKIALTLEYQKISANLYDKWKLTHADHQKPFTLATPSNDPGAPDDTLYIYAPAATFDLEKQLVLAGLPANPALHQPPVPVRIDVYSHNHVLLLSYTADEVGVNVGEDELSAGAIAVSLNLRKNVVRANHTFAIPPVPAGAAVDIPCVGQTPPSASSMPSDKALLDDAEHNSSPSLQLRFQDAELQKSKLKHTIISELHSRGSFAVSCLTLVLLGAALGILLRGKNPLAVFVVGFVPAIFLVLLITAGREMAEGGSNRTVPIGLSLIWAGNAILILLVLSVYAKLLRR